MRRLIALLILSPALALAQAVPDDPAERARRAQETEQALARLREDVAALKASLAERRGAESQAVAALADAERAVSAHHQALADIEARRVEQETTLAGLEARRGEIDARIGEQRDALAALLRLTYVRARNAPVRRLLDPAHAPRLARSLGYARILQRSRLDRIDALLVSLRQLDAVARAQQQSLVALDESRAAALAEREALAASVAERERALDVLRRELADAEQRVAALGQDERAMLRLLEQLRDIFADLPKTLDGAQPFSSLRGSLPWPADGAAEARHGGVLIAAQAGAPVRAIAHGRIAFADWLKGYGLLLIVDHGDGYMSLYGHNEALLKPEGAWVQAGDTIATVGRSGGEDRAGLHFELRERGRSTDPRRWLRKR